MFSHIQNFDVKPYNKIHFGEVNTDFTLIHRILDLLPAYLFNNPHLTWLDPCCGCGYFSIALYQRLFKSLQTLIPNQKKRKKHIITHMIYMIEINPEHIPRILSIFGENANIIMGDFLSLNNMQFDVIIGNPPFTCGGIIKTPTNTVHKKKYDGKSIWAAFIRCALTNLTPGGYLATITPSIWMKQDHSFHSYMRQWQIRKLHTLSSTETNRIFHGHAQTPTCYFSLQKQAHTHPLSLYDTTLQNYISYNHANTSIPLYAASIIKKLHLYVSQYGSIKVIKTSMRPGYKKLHLSPTKDAKHPFPNISTCTLKGQQPILRINYSNIPCSHAGQPKLVLAHKMYGFPYHDSSGNYGISNRDNYVIVGPSYKDLQQLKQFLSTKLALLVFKTTRYRMQYLERYAFDFLPDITKIADFPIPIHDQALADYFQFTPMERLAIQTVTKKSYLPSIIQDTCK